MIGKFKVFEPQRTQRSRRLFINFFFVFVVLVVVNFQALAEEASVYSPEFCEFSITFPDEPYKTRRCDDDGKQCYDQISYTQVWGMDSTVNFRVICNPIGGDVYAAYSPEVMDLTLRALTKNSVVKEFDSSFRETADYKQAGLVGEGLSGRTPTIYLAQLWIGKQSALSVEAELIGEALPDADALFSTVLKSVGLKVDSSELVVDSEVDSKEETSDN